MSLGMRRSKGLDKRRPRRGPTSQIGRSAPYVRCRTSPLPPAYADVLAGRPICIGPAFHNRQTPSSARQVRRAGSATGLFSRSAGPRRTSQWVETFRFIAGIAMAAEAAAFAEPRCLSSVSMSKVSVPGVAGVPSDFRYGSEAEIREPIGCVRSVPIADIRDTGPSAAR